ncbi:HNH endonuclease [Niveibacterium sp. SC-1]|uniref:HNH endonuclease n=1 Tax=Niveibacterium sp. SC-1 TaxID=3135646 RepID=UPI00311F88A6
MTTFDPSVLAESISAETGLGFVGSDGRSADGVRWLEVVPAGHPLGQTFAIRAEIGWRRIDVRFRLGSFAGDLLASTRSADETGRRVFQTVLDACQKAGAGVALIVNGTIRNHRDDAVWEDPWRSFGFVVGKGMLAINEGNDTADMRLIEEWATRATAAVIALLPVEEEARGLPEGAKLRIEVNRYERDRRNRTAALAIHGHKCMACGTDMAERYGAAAEGLIEVHHTIPVSEVGPGYIIDPGTDLIPLCPDCHSVAHRRSPPYSVKELRNMLRPNLPA